MHESLLSPGELSASECKNERERPPEEVALVGGVLEFVTCIGVDEPGVGKRGANRQIIAQRIPRIEAKR